MNPMITSPVDFTPASVLAISISSLGRLPRSPWAVEVLVEQLAAEAPDDTSLQRAVRRLRMKSSSGLLLDMAAKKVIKPLGDGATAVYVIADGFAQRVTAVEQGLTGEEADALRRAAQRSNAIFAAWAKASATWAPSTDGDITVAQARRHAVR